MSLKISENDKQILRKLAERYSQIASEEINKERASLWTDLNDLKSKRPMVWINEICWHEMNYNDELTLQCEGEFAKSIEDPLRKTIYQWDHLQGDMVVNNFIDCPAVFTDSGFGFEEDVDIVKTDDSNDVVSRHFNRLIKEPEDIEKFKEPVITYEKDQTEENFLVMQDIFKDIIEVKKVGPRMLWFTPWDNLIRWWGVQEAMMDLILRPEMVQAFVEKFVDLSLVRLEQFVKLGLLSPSNDNARVGSGGYGYISGLPGVDAQMGSVTPDQMWGCSNAQIFSEVSPEMHWDFALKYEMKWLEKWGANYYGCCEPLHHKMDLMQKIPNLRKISMSPWVNPERAVNEVGQDYVYSLKPNPAVLAETQWDPAKVEKELRESLKQTRGCHVEVILKDISTVRYQPQRLWEWADICSKIINDFQR